MDWTIWIIVGILVLGVAGIYVLLHFISLESNNLKYEQDKKDFTRSKMEYKEIKQIRQAQDYKRITRR